MNRSLFMGVGIMALIALLFLAFSGSDAPSDRTPTPTPPPKAVIIPVESEVLVKQPGDGDFVMIKKEAEVRGDTEIKTSAAGRARIFYPNGTIANVEHDSHVRVKKLDSSGGQSRLQLITGSVWAKIKNILGKGEYFEIETENVVANVRGTVFGIQFRDGVSQVIGIQHSVRVDGWDPVGQRAIAQIGTLVDSREKLRVQGPAAARSAVFLTTPIMPEDLQNEEIKRNMIDLLEPAEAQDPMILDLIKETQQLNPQDKDLLRMIQLKGFIPSASNGPTIHIDTTVGDLKIEVSGLPQPKTTPTP